MAELDSQQYKKTSYYENTLWMSRTYRESFISISRLRRICISEEKQISQIHADIILSFSHGGLQRPRTIGEKIIHDFRVKEIRMNMTELFYPSKQ